MEETVPVPKVGLFSELAEVGSWTLRQFWLRLQWRNPLWRYILGGKPRILSIWALDWCFHRPVRVGGGRPLRWTCDMPCWVEEFTFYLNDGAKVSTLVLWPRLPMALDPAATVELDLDGTVLEIRSGAERWSEDLPPGCELAAWSLQVRRRHV